jgi:curved DNA-binding protein CbpA
MSLSATDGFVLSRVDGSLSERDLAASMGLPAEQVLAALAKLESLGLITFANGQAPAPTASGTVPATPRGASADPTPLTPEDAALMAENVDIDEETKRTILRTHARLDQLHHYALLGIEREADRKGVKRAYYELAGKFHPDKYFRKNLGSFKVRMEALFARITLAHDTLADRERREEYDAYLVERLRTRSAEDRLADALDEARRIEHAVEREARAAGDRSFSPMPGPAASPAPAASPLSPVMSQPAPAPATGPPPNVDIAARRDALARRLLGGRAPGAGVSSAPPARGPSAPPVATLPTTNAMDALKRRYEDRVARAKSAEARKYISTAEAALAAGDPIAAANAYRVASTLVPGDPEVAKAAEKTQGKAEEVLGDTYLKQAEYEERHKQWVEASRSWSRVCKARPDDARAHERAAHALLACGGDLHKAGRFGKRACELEPDKPALRVTLAQVYVAAGLPLSARRELETAAQLSPQDDTIRTMLKQL